MDTRRALAAVARSPFHEYRGGWTSRSDPKRTQREHRERSLDPVTDSVYLYSPARARHGHRQEINVFIPLLWLPTCEHSRAGQKTQELRCYPGAPVQQITSPKLLPSRINGRFRDVSSFEPGATSFTRISSIFTRERMDLDLDLRKALIADILF